MKKIPIICHNGALIAPIFRRNGDWIDLRAAEDVHIPAGTAKKISLGISMQLPKGYEAEIRPRSSTFRYWGILQTNGVGVVDNSYRGTNDIWFVEEYATRDTHIEFNDRICQFRIRKKQPKFEFTLRRHFTTPDRGGHGSTGTK